jgi:hypothetical protein
MGCCVVRVRLTAICILVAAAVASGAAAQGVASGQIRGRVVSGRDSEPLGLVQVALMGTMFSAVSDADGAFRITGVPAGSYTLQASAVDYRVIQQVFTLAAGESKAFEIVLTPTTITLTDTAVVSADPFVETQPAASGFTLQGDEQKNLASVLSDDPLRAVQSAPGVTSNDDFSSAFSVRGAPFRRIGVYLDGVLLHSPFHTTDGVADNGSLTVFNGDLTDDLTLYQGGWPVRYSDRTAGVLAVDTREGTRQELRTQVSASASNASVLAEGPLGASKRGSWLFDFRRSYLQYILNRIDLGDQPPIAFGFTDGEGRLDFDLAPRHAVSLTYLDGTSAVDRSRFVAELGPNTVMTSGFRFTMVNLGSRYATPRLLVSTHAAVSREKGGVDNRDLLPLSAETYMDGTARSDATFLWTSRNTFDFGGQYRHTRERGATTQLVYAPSLTSTRDDFNGAANEAGAYVEDEITVRGARLVAGARLDDESVEAAPVTSPFASVAFDASSRTHVQFDWGEYAQFPELSQVFSTFAVNRLVPERATHYDAAIDRRLDSRTRLRLEFYDRQDHDLLARPALEPRLSPGGAVIDAAPGASLLNSEDGYGRGVEVMLQRRTANGFTGWVSYAYGRAIVSDAVLAQSFPADYDQRHTVNAYISRRIRPTVNFSGRFTFGSGMPLPGFYQFDAGVYDLATDRNGVRAPAYERTDVRLNKAYVHQNFNATLFAEVVNVTNHSNRDFDAAGPYDPQTRRNTPTFYSMFPILPSVGMVVSFGTHRQSGG